MILAIIALILWDLILTAAVLYLHHDRPTPLQVPEEPMVTHITHVSTPRPYRVP